MVFKVGIDINNKIVKFYSYTSPPYHIYKPYDYDYDYFKDNVLRPLEEVKINNVFNIIKDNNEQKLRATISNLLSCNDVIIEILPKSMRLSDLNIENIRLESINQSTINNKYTNNLLRYNPVSNDYVIEPNYLLNSYLLSNNIANACFYYIIINTYKKQFENKKDAWGYRINKFDLTFDSLHKLFNEELYNNSQLYDDKEMEIEIDKTINKNMSLTFKQSTVFFKKFKLNLLVIDQNNKIVYEYKNEKVNENFYPKCLKVLFHNNHVYPITEDNNQSYKI